MIHISDTTIIEGLGNYHRVSDIMLRDEGLDKWMLSSDFTVQTDEVTSNFLLHFWDDGRVFIKETDHPPSVEIYDSDLKELKEWCEQGGWKLHADDRLLIGNVGFQFWLQKYREGIVFSDMLEKYDKDESDRMTALLAIEREEEGDLDAD